MEACVIVTYRCNARCRMCSTWENPTRRTEEIGPDIVEKLPDGLRFINITGGEPFLREDIADIACIAVRKAKRVVVSTNGYFTDRILALAKRHPGIGFRISIEGLPAANDRLRGLQDGFDHGMRSLLGLMAAGVRDVGFGITVSDENAKDMMELYRLASAMGVEFATAATHNSYYFHKHDNTFKDPLMVAAEFDRLASEMLSTTRVKNWFRAYFNSGLGGYVLGARRPLPCHAGTDMFFLDPFGRVTPCNGSDTEMIMGDLNTHTFSQVWHSAQAVEVRETVKGCAKNCWMIGTAAPAMKKDIIKPLGWILKRKTGLP